ncbi:MAG: amidohydrolase family protein [Planctomycetes bacterium]|nr:amidohydrolase family protein [Planctomycetota bacterium]
MFAVLLLSLCQEPPAAPASTADPVALPAPEVLLLDNATVHIGAAGQPPAVRDVLIEDGRIRQVEIELSAPPGARVIDLAGAHLVPGLIDALVGFDPDHDALYLDAGVTLVRDGGNAIERIQKLRDPAARDAAQGPAVLSSLVRVEGNRPASPAAIQLVDVAKAESLLPVLFEEQPDWIYVADALPQPVFEKLLALCTERGLSVWSSQRAVAAAGASNGAPGASNAQASGQLALPACLALGQRAFLYMDSLLPTGADWESVQPGAFDESVAALGAAQARCSPLLMGLVQRLRDPGERAPILELLAPMYATQWEADRALRKELMERPDFFKLGERVTKKQRALLLRLHEAGVALVPGSGAPSPWIAPGGGLHDELALWVEAGIPRAAVLEHATRGAARALGLGAERGSIEPGRIADLLIVDADPSTDLAVLRRPRAVVLRGRWLDRAAIGARLDRLRTALDARRAREREPLEVAPPDLPDGTLVLSGHLETIGLGSRVSGERWAVVRENDGAIAFVSRIVIPSDGQVAAREMTVLQRTRRGELEEFEVALRNGTDKLVVRGIWIAGRFSIDRRLNGNFLGGVPIPQRVAAVDVGSATTPLVLGLREKGGRLPVLYLHDALVPELVPWLLEFRENGGLLAQTPQGGLGVQQAPDGSIALWREARGPSVLEARILESRADAGGLPPSKSRVISAPASRPAGVPEPHALDRAAVPAAATPAPSGG